ncbi:MAG TPA: DUF192 domain-containing protein [Rhizomicrobium sp.]
MRLTIAFVSLLLFAGAAYADSNTAQPMLPVETISIDTAKGPVRLKVELATTWPQQEAGLMFRRHMAAGAGMLFDFHQPTQMAFWMKNTYLPLDMLFIRADGTVSSIAAKAKPLSTQSIPSTEPVQAVLEINAGQAAALGLREGAKVHSTIFSGGR